MMLLFFFISNLNISSTSLLETLPDYSLNFPISVLLGVQPNDTALGEALVEGNKSVYMMQTQIGNKLEQRGKPYPDHNIINRLRIYDKKKKKKTFRLNTGVKKNHISRRNNYLWNNCKKKLKKYWPLLIVACIYTTREVVRN